MSYVLPVCNCPLWGNRYSWPSGPSFPQNIPAFMSLPVAPFKSLQHGPGGRHGWWFAVNSRKPRHRGRCLDSESRADVRCGVTLRLDRPRFAAKDPEWFIPTGTRPSVTTFADLFSPKSSSSAGSGGRPPIRPYASWLVNGHSRNQVKLVGVYPQARPRGDQSSRCQRGGGAGKCGGGNNKQETNQQRRKPHPYAPPPPTPSSLCQHKGHLAPILLDFAGRSLLFADTAYARNFPKLPGVQRGDELTQPKPRRTPRLCRCIQHPGIRQALYSPSTPPTPGRPPLILPTQCAPCLRRPP